MKKVKVAAALVLSALSMSTFAQTADLTVNVNASLTEVCRLTVAGAADLNFSYTAFETGPVAATPVSRTFECTRGFGANPAVSWDGAGAVGVVAGLRYTLGTSVTGTTAGTAAGTGVGAIGTPATYTYQITGSMEGGQAGDSSLGTQDVRTMTITF
jgi:hypothetical protein